jgi:Chaperone of endosialidase
VNAWTVKGSIPAGTGGKWALFTKANGGSVTERLSVDNAGLAILQNTSGGLLIGKTATDTTTAGIQIGDSGSGNNTRVNMVGSGTSSDTKIAFYNGNGGVGSITTNGTATAYNTSSDARLKTVLGPLSAGALIDSISVYDFAWNSGGFGRGAIAQELHAVVPDAVTVGGDDPLTDPWQVDYSKLVPLLVAEVKALRARVAALES